MYSSGFYSSCITERIAHFMKKTVKRLTIYMFLGSRLKLIQFFFQWYHEQQHGHHIHLEEKRKNWHVFSHIYILIADFWIWEVRNLKGVKIPRSAMLLSLDKRGSVCRVFYFMYVTEHLLYIFITQLIKILLGKVMLLNLNLWFCADSVMQNWSYIFITMVKTMGFQDFCTALCTVHYPCLVCVRDVDYAACCVLRVRATWCVLRVRAAWCALRVRVMWCVLRAAWCMMCDACARCMMHDVWWVWMRCVWAAWCMLRAAWCVMRDVFCVCVMCAAWCVLRVHATCAWCVMRVHAACACCVCACVCGAHCVISSAFCCMCLMCAACAWCVLRAKFCVMCAACACCMMCDASACACCVWGPLRLSVVDIR